MKSAQRSMMSTATVRIISEPDLCAHLWSLGPSFLPFRSWELRSALASIYGVAPSFLLDERTGATLPLGMSGPTSIFFGGLRYSEHNMFLGPVESRGKLLAAAFASPQNLSLLAWDEDPLACLSPEYRHCDVPFNQYWMIPEASKLASHLALLPDSVRKEVEYVLRKFEYSIVPLAPWSAAKDTISRFAALTSESFARRGRRSFLDDPRNMRAASTVCEHACRAGALHGVEVQYGGETIGLCVIIDDPSAPDAVYLISLSGTAPSKVSNAVTLAPLVYADRTGRSIDGMRGSFTLKKKYGYLPKPSYAIVRDPSWEVRPQSDLSAEELLALYGRDFGCAKSA